MTKDITGQGIPRRAQMNLVSRLSELSRLRFFVRSFWEAEAGFSHDETGADALELAVNEAAANVIRHAFSGMDNKNFSVTALAWPDRVVVELTHNGHGFPPPRNRACLPPEPQDHGYGLYIIENCLDKVAYCTGDGGLQRIIMEKRPAPKKG